MTKLRVRERLQAIAKWWTPVRVEDALEVAAAVLVVSGVALWSVALALIVAGVAVWFIAHPIKVPGWFK
ncbi:hypothetical protein [Microbacterium allomyrinae]|uniref:Uncharacterized protein n=1 Tax=Microbacterium allomyrinae TaxID=2830666 RepID=A0A9X1LS22_9MICO|nr:hypothetical protein [Microbacterium allomyrinae]MCC2030623.1 hypothetical protein [Microbacterium allomyrinae]